MGVLWTVSRRDTPNLFRGALTSSTGLKLLVFFHLLLHFLGQVLEVLHILTGIFLLCRDAGGGHAALF